MDKIYKTDREWYAAAKEAYELFAKKVCKETVLGVQRVWNDRYPEFFNNRKSADYAAFEAACSVCVWRYKDRMTKRFKKLEDQFAEEDKQSKDTEPSKKTKGKK